MFKKKYDLNLLKNVIRFYSLIGTFSFNKKFVLIILLPYFLAGEIIHLTIRVKYFNEHFMSISNLCLFISFMIIKIMYSGVCVRDNWNHYKLDAWNGVISDIDSFDFKVGKNRKMFKDSTSIYLKIMLVNISYGILILLTYSTQISSIQFAITSSYLYIVNLQMFSTILVLGMILDMIMKRYEFLRMKTFEVYQSINKERLIWNSLQLEDSYLLLTNTVKNVNEFFGIRILLIFILAFLGTVGRFQYYLFEDIKLSIMEVRSFFGNGAEIVSYLVSIVSIISGLIYSISVAKYD